MSYPFWVFPSPLKRSARTLLLEVLAASAPTEQRDSAFGASDCASFAMSVQCRAD